MAVNQSVRQTVASNIKRIRKERGMTQAQLAELTELSNTYIANIECAKTWISDTTLERLSAALDVDFYAFFVSDDSASVCLPDSFNSILNKYKKQCVIQIEQAFSGLKTELESI